MKKTIEKYREWLRLRTHDSAADERAKNCSYHEGKSAGFFEAYRQLCILLDKK